MKRIAAALATCSLFASGSALAADQWEHVIGTGLFGLNIEGDVGITVAGRTVELKDAKLDSSEVRDYMDSAFGFTGSSAKGDLRIIYGYSMLSLEDKQNGVLAGVPVSGKTTFDATNANLSGVYTFARNNYGNWGVLGGLRYYKQELDIKANTATTSARLKRDESWTDVLVGLTHILPVGKDVVWRSQIDAGIGDGNSYHFNTGLGWRFAKNWSTDLYYDYKSYDYENGHKGSADWYLYDADEYGVGLGIAYHF